MSKRRYWFSFVLILFVAAFLRFYKLGQIPVSLYWDEAAILLDAKVISQTGQDMHGGSWLQVLFPSYGDFKLPVYIWLATLGVKLLGFTELAVRLPSALVGLATIILSGLISREIFFKFSNKKKDYLQLVTMLVVSISPWSVMFSRTAFEGHLGQSILALSVWIILKSKDRQKLILLSPILGALATYTYFSVRFVWPVVFISMALLVLKKKAWKWILPALIIFGLLILPMIKSPLYEESNKFRYSTTSVLNAFDYPVESNQYRELAGSSVVDRVLFHRHWLMARELIRNYADNLSLNYLFLTGDPNLRHGTGKHGLFLLIFLPILLIGFYRLFKEQRFELLALIIWWLIALLPASVPETTPHSLRSLNALVPISVILGYGLVSLVEKKSKVFKLVIGLLIFFSIFEFSNHYFTYYAADSAYDWQDGYKEMALEINQALPHVADVYIDEFDDRFYLWLLSYGDFTPEEIQAMPKENYQVKKVEKITFDKYHWSKIDSLDRKILVVGLKKDINEGLDEYKIQPTWEKEIFQANGEAPFKIVMLERQN
jgi:4-amino-4-deoxy-L-arabinose transferase-like glycosyltransferase